MVRIFISHSSKDKWLIDPIAANLKLIEVEPYLAELVVPNATSLPQKLQDAINQSEAVFVFWTANVANNQSTRDVVNWEISAAYHMNPKKPIYIFAEKEVSLPAMLNYVTVYARYDPLSKETLKDMVTKVQSTALSIKDNADKTKTAALLIMLGLGLLGLFALGDK